MSSVLAIVTPAALDAYLAAIEQHFLGASFAFCACVGLVIAWRRNPPAKQRRNHQVDPG